eukprot:NODE_1518_length_829_cov_118.497151_g1470_i0.p1 GENE.NODE_1518_length_829_cov_118.497151_g1470_i0~~NODE_1518_length_829_cov_118.497151_g1470_i0.p1  ORF type:complete len:187 (-),score=15.41 NODE_1518_length_829_cov_118.497151_g1470_i0:166-726(-)
MGATPEEVLKLTAPTDGFLCPLSANEYNIEFLSFTIRDLDHQKVLFEVSRDAEGPQTGAAHPPADADPETAARTIQYDFPKSFLRHKTIGTKLVFSVGDKPVPNFRMIERHYFKDKLIKSFDFTFGFCIPNSTNSWEAIYDLPRLDSAEEDDIISHPYGTKSDSFYFVNDQLVMHNKAEYGYTLDE